MDIFYAIAAETLRTFLLAAPFLLFGLLAAGLIHVLLPAAVIERWLGRPGMKGVTWAALVGVPLPVCSCGVVPIAVEMRKKGASRPASLSLLTTTPESSIDSILLTWGLMGPVMAVARPLAAFLTAVLGGALAIFTLPEDDEAPKPASSCGSTCGDATDCCSTIGTSNNALATLKAWRPWRRRPDAPSIYRTVVRPALDYGFRELLDDLAFWLLLGIVLAGIVGGALPSDLAERGLGSGFLPMLAALVVGVPLYMCASASTPIAAALLAKGLGPGAALVFLLAGPATNIATLVLLTRTFGRRFVAVYLASVVAGALIAGFALDAAVLHFALTIAAAAPVMGEAFFAVVEWAAFVVLAVLLAASFARGSGTTGWRELKSGFAGLRT